MFQKYIAKKRWKMSVLPGTTSSKKRRKKGKTKSIFYLLHFDWWNERPVTFHIFFFQISSANIYIFFFQLARYQVDARGKSNGLRTRPIWPARLQPEKPMWQLDLHAEQLLSFSESLRETRGRIRMRRCIWIVVSMDTPSQSLFPLQSWLSTL